MKTERLNSVILYVSVVVFILQAVGYLAPAWFVQEIVLKPEQSQSMQADSRLFLFPHICGQAKNTGALTAEPDNVPEAESQPNGMQVPDFDDLFSNFGDEVPPDLSQDIKLTTSNQARLPTTFATRVPPKRAILSPPDDPSKTADGSAKGVLLPNAKAQLPLFPLNGTRVTPVTKKAIRPSVAGKLPNLQPNVGASLLTESSDVVPSDMFLTEDVFISLAKAKSVSFSPEDDVIPSEAGLLSNPDELSSEFIFTPSLTQPPSGSIANGRLKPGADVSGLSDEILARVRRKRSTQLLLLTSIFNRPANNNLSKSLNDSVDVETQTDATNRLLPIATDGKTEEVQAQNTSVQVDRNNLKRVINAMVKAGLINQTNNDVPDQPDVFPALLGVMQTRSTALNSDSTVSNQSRVDVETQTDAPNTLLSIDTDGKTEEVQAQNTSIQVDRNYLKRVINAMVKAGLINQTNSDVPDQPDVFPALLGVMQTNIDVPDVIPALLGAMQTRSTALNTDSTVNNQSRVVEVLNEIIGGLETNAQDQPDVVDVAPELTETFEERNMASVVDQKDSSNMNSLLDPQNAETVGNQTLVQEKMAAMFQNGNQQLYLTAGFWYSRACLSVRHSLQNNDHVMQWCTIYTRTDNDTFEKKANMLELRLEASIAVALSMISVVIASTTCRYKRYQGRRAIAAISVLFLSGAIMAVPVVHVIVQHLQTHDSVVRERQWSQVTKNLHKSHDLFDHYSAILCGVASTISILSAILFVFVTWRLWNGKSDEENCYDLEHTKGTKEDKGFPLKLATHLNHGLPAVTVSKEEMKTDDSESGYSELKDDADTQSEARDDTCQAETQLESE